MTMTDPRDLVGYGANPPHAGWPNGARIALQLVLNYEEGAERSVLYGDAHAETFLSEMFNPDPFPDRHLSMESLYEYGSRAGFWRAHRLLTELGVPVTIFGVAEALVKNPAAVSAMKAAGWEIASHSLRWINYQTMPIEEERAHIQRAIELHTQATGERPTGWYTGRDSPNTRELVIEAGGFLYDSDSYADDLPYWVGDDPHLVIPYTLDTNDMRFASPYGFTTADDFYQYLRDSFDVLYAEGATQPKMMNVGLHCRIIGKPGRIGGLRRFLEHVQSHEDVWICRRVDIARHWHQHHRPS